MTEPEAERVRAAITSAHASDALDALGLRRQVLPYDIRGLEPNSRIVAHAYPVRGEEGSGAGQADSPVEKLQTALRGLAAGEVLVFGTERSEAASVWGGFTTLVCRERGAAGVLTDGLIRDTAEIRISGFPAFSRGATPRHSHDRLDLIDWDCPVLVDDVLISPGDLIVADADGVCVVPAAREAEVLALAAEFIAAGERFKAAIRSGLGPFEALAAHGGE